MDLQKVDLSKVDLYPRPSPPEGGGTTVNSLVSGHPREFKKVSVSRAVRLRELFP